MTPIEVETLDNCFQTVFPTLSLEEVHKASMEGMEKWDSLATVTLVSIIEGEFDIEIAEEHLEKFVSYSEIRELVAQELSA